MVPGVKSVDLRIPIVLALVVAGLGVVGWLWFVKLGQQSGLGFGVLALLYGAGASVLISRLFGKRAQRQFAVAAVRKADPAKRQAAQLDFEQRKARRIAELEADPDPRKRKYVEEARQGILATDQQIAYDLDPVLTATCEHLRPVELAQRQAGIAMRPSGYYGDPPAASVSCGCSIAIDSVRHRFVLPDFVTYEEEYEFVHEAAQLECKQCKSCLSLAVPRGSRVPVFA